MTRRDSTGYVSYRVGYRTDREHRRVLRELGVDLTGKVVHHIDGDRRNNSPANLVAMTHREHLKLHYGTVTEPDRYSYVPEECPDCHLIHMVRYDFTKRPNYTGCCRECGQRRRWV